MRKNLEKALVKKGGYETVVMLSQEEEALSARVSDKSSSSCRASKKHPNSHFAFFVALHTYCFFDLVIHFELDEYDEVCEEVAENGEEDPPVDHEVPAEDQAVGAAQKGPVCDIARDFLTRKNITYLYYLACLDDGRRKEGKKL